MGISRRVFNGTERFDIKSRLGEGGFGVVYLAYDRERDSIVALKTLHDMDPEALYSFKKEFRALADVTHPNLVALYELISEQEQWFFTMELVKGVDLLSYVREGNRLDLARLRSTLTQLAEGICSLHKAGKLHCDIKPSNILVTPEGRVVLLDFGMVTELARLRFEQDSGAGGTPVFMAPEQAAGLPLTEASDWYSVGVVLFEALTDRLPFLEESFRVLKLKQELDPPAPSEVSVGIPDDLDSLCLRLISRDPRQRPTGDEVLSILARGGRESSTISSFNQFNHPLVGRERHLDELERAFQAIKERKTSVVYIEGRSGMGKSSLIRHFLEDLEHRDREVVILTGRCYEQESVPYKALDSLIDSLSQYLKSLSSVDAILMMPRDVTALARLFPVLNQVAALSSAQRRVLEIPDSRELRRRAFSAFRDLLARIADKKPLVLFIDDLQWGDLDSASLLGELLRPPNPPNLLLLAGYRSEDLETSPFLRAFLQSHREGGTSIESRRVIVGELSFDESRDLAMQLLGIESRDSSARAEIIAREANGSPYFVDELTRFIGTDRELMQMSGVFRLDKIDTGSLLTKTTLDNVIYTRVSELPADARALLEVVAVAGRPLRPATARQAARMSNQLNADENRAIDEHKTLVLLRGGRLVRSRGAEDGSRIEAYHDRIRETVVAHLSPESLRSHHQHLAWVLEASKEADPESLMIHYHGAGETKKAAQLALSAAEQAAGALAFDHAARLYRFALELLPQDGNARELRVKLGDALANAGRGAEAAREYLAALDGSTEIEAIELQRRAAEQFLISGHTDDGMPVVRAVLKKLNFRLAKTPTVALLSLLFHRAIIKLRGLNYREREAGQIPAEELIRIDTCWSVSTGLWIVDILSGVDFQTRYSILALRSGEPTRVVRGMACEAGYHGVNGGRYRHHTDRLLEKTRALAERANTHDASAVLYVTEETVAYFRGSWKEAYQLSEKAEKILREHCIGMRWELNQTQIYSLESLYFLGRMKDLSSRLELLLKEVGERGDLYMEIYLRTLALHRVLLASDEPGRAVEEASQAISRWSHQGFHFPHWWVVCVQVSAALYSGDGREAWRVIDEKWKFLTRSLFHRIQLTFIYSSHLHAYSALAAAATGYRREELLKIAERDAANIEREKMEWGNSIARLIRAGIARERGRRDEAIELLARAERGFESVDMAFYASAARRRRGELIGGDEGLSLVKDADEWMTEQNIKRPDKMAVKLAP